MSILQKFTRIELSQSESEELRVAVSEVDDWTALIEQAELYAISSLVLKHCLDQKFTVPQPVLLSLKALAMRHRLAADARYTLLQELLAVFSENQVPVVALKGLALAPMIYPSDHERAMRDIDVLVERSKESQAADLIKQMGFHLPDAQPSKYMRASHQLPNATKQVSGFTVSLEIHHDALAADSPGHLFYEDVQADLRQVKWRDIEFFTLGHAQMLHQLCIHLEGFHPGAVLKLINVLDVVLYSERFMDEIDWDAVKQTYPHVINTLKCLHLIVPLSDDLSHKVGGVKNLNMKGVGETIRPLKHVLSSQNSLKNRFHLLFQPSDWWLHLYYNVDPSKSLIAVKLLRHPLTILSWLTSRLYSRAMGG